MSGLFRALVDAARGRTPVLLPRPHPVFAPAEAPALLPEPRLDEMYGMNEIPQVRRESPAAGRRARGRDRAGEAAEATVPERDDEVQEAPLQRRRAGSRAIGSEPEDSGTPSARRFQPPAVRDFVGLPVDGDGPNAEAAPRLKGAPSVERGDGPGFPPREYEPLLPPRAEVPVAAPASRDPGREAHLPEPAEARGAAASPREASGAPRIDLRIGRIEIVAPAAPAMAKASARATIVPRARPRQSLDDYLSRRRR